MAKVLLVEDDNNLREIFEMRLQAEGYETAVASDGEEALVVALREKPDLVIADIMMPKMSGFEMVETLRAAPDMKDVKVIMMTALGQAEDRARGEKLGVVKYLVKSQVTLEDFVRAVKEVLGTGGGATGQTNSAAGQTQAASTSNNKGSEKKMDDNNQTSNPAPGGDNQMPDTNPISGPPASGGMNDDQMSTDQQKAAMDDQVDEAMGPQAPAPGGDSPAMPAADSPAPSAPSEPPAGMPPTEPAEPASGEGEAKPDDSGGQMPAAGGM